MADRERRLSLVATVDEKTVQRGQKEIAQLRREFEQLEAVERGGVRASNQAASGIGEVNSATRTSIRFVKERIDALEALNKALLDQVRILKQQEQAQQRAGAGGNFSTANQFNSDVRQRAGLLGDVETALGALELQGVGRAFGALEGVAQLQASLKGLPASVSATASALLGVEVSFATVAAAAAPIAVAFAGVAAAGRKLFLILEDGKARLDGAIAAQEEYIRAVVEGDQERIQSSLEQARIDREVAQTQAQLLEQQRQSLTGLQKVFAGGTGVQSFFRLGQLNKEIREQQQEADAAGQLVNRLNQALEDEAVQARAAAEAESELRQARIEQVAAQAEAARRARELGETGTSEQAQARLDAIRREQDAIDQQIAQIEQYVDGSGEYEQAIADLRERSKELADEQRRIAQTALPLIRAREREADAIERQKEALEQAADVRESQAAFNDDIAEIEKRLGEQRVQIIDSATDSILQVAQQAAEKERQIRLDALRDEEQDTRELLDDIFDVRQERGDREVELQIETNQRIEDLYERNRRELERIEKDFGRARQDAIRNRDAVALQAAEEAREDQLDKAQDQLDEGVDQEVDAYERRLEEGKRADRQRIRDLRQAYDREKRERRIALDQEIGDLQSAASARIRELRDQRDAELQQLKRKGEEQIAERQAQFSQELIDLGAHISRMTKLNQSGLNALAEQLKDFYENVTSTSSQTPYSGPYDTFASGVRNFRGGLAITGERGPELGYWPGGTNIYNNNEFGRILNALASGQSGGSTFNLGGVSMPVNVSAGLDQAGIQRAIERAVGGALRRELPRQMTALFRGMS